MDGTIALEALLKGCADDAFDDGMVAARWKGTPWPLEMGPPEHSETALAWR